MSAVARQVMHDTHVLSGSQQEHVLLGYKATYMAPYHCPCQLHCIAAIAGHVLLAVYVQISSGQSSDQSNGQCIRVYAGFTLR